MHSCAHHLLEERPDGIARITAGHTLGQVADIASSSLRRRRGGRRLECELWQAEADRCGGTA
eukprot:scaffold41540_cov32-Tisochrysis_lutea.AAC.2